MVGPHCPTTLSDCKNSARWLKLKCDCAAGLKISKFDIGAVEQRFRSPGRNNTVGAAAQREIPRASHTQFLNVRASAESDCDQQSRSNRSRVSDTKISLGSRPGVEPCPHQLHLSRKAIYFLQLQNRPKRSAASRLALTVYNLRSQFRKAGTGSRPIHGQPHRYTRSLPDRNTSNNQRRLQNSARGRVEVKQSTLIVKHLHFCTIANKAYAC